MKNCTGNTFLLIKDFFNHHEFYHEHWSKVKDYVTETKFRIIK